MQKVKDTTSFWNDVLVLVKAELTPGQYATWFARTRCDDASESALVLAVETAFAKDWLVRNYEDVIRRVTFQVVGWSFTDLSLVIDESLAQVPRNDEDEVPSPRPTSVTPREDKERWQGDLSPLRSQVVLNSDYSFDNFVVGPSNRLAHAATLAVVEDVGRTYNPLFVHGKLGLGKTHLLQAICHQIYARNPRTRLLYIPCEVFINAFISALEKNKVDAFRDRYRQLDVLVIDDIHFLANKDHTQEEFFHTFNALYNDHKQIILSSDSPPRDIPELEERLVSRFKWGMVCEIEAPTYETRLAIIRKKGQLENIEVPDNVAEYLADSIRGSIRELEGAVTKLLAFASLMKADLTMETAKIALSGLVDFDKKRVSIEQIIDLVTEHYGVRLSDLQSKKRFQSITRPRQICMYLIRELTSLSLSEIGGYFGGRDHSTVIYGYEKVKKTMDSDLQFRSLVDGFLRKLETD